MNEQALSRALKNCLSGVTFDQARQQTVLEYMEGGKTASRRLSFVMAVLVSLLLLGGTALAAGLGLFGQFAQEKSTGASTSQLNLLENVAMAYDQTRTLIVDGETVQLTLHQAYCDGVRLYYSYEIKGAVLGDGADLADGTPTMIYESDERELEDGTVIGYQTVELPEGVKLGDTLDILLPVHNEMVPFTIQVNHIQRELMNHMEFDTYTAEALLQQTEIVLTGKITLNCPKEWTSAAITNDSNHPTKAAEYVQNYSLLCHGTSYENNYPAVAAISEGLMEITLLFDLPADPTEFILVPIYNDGNEHPAEAITLLWGTSNE